MSDAHAAGSKLTLGYSLKAGAGSPVEVTKSVSIEFSYSYTHTETTSRTVTKTQGLTVSQNFTAPPHSTYTGRLVAQMGKLAPTTFSTVAKRWYAEPLPGTVPDPANHNWHMRTEKITGTVEGRLCCKTYMEVKSQDL